MYMPTGSDAAHYLTMTWLPYGILMRLGSAATDGTTKYIVSLREPAARTISSWEFKYSCKYYSLVIQDPIIVAVCSIRYGQKY